MDEKRAKLTPVMADYLEVIYRLVALDGSARARDIGRRLGVSLPTVSRALKTLAEMDLVAYSPYRTVTLTERGREEGADVVRRHEALTNFLTTVLLLDPEEAERDARGMKHALGEHAMDRLLRFVEFMRFCPRGRARWAEGFAHFCEHGETGEACRRCIDGKR